MKDWQLTIAVLGSALVAFFALVAALDWGSVRTWLRRWRGVERH